MSERSQNRRATLKEVASSAGVAAITVSYVLSGRGDEMRISESTQRRVVDAARQLGYRKNGLAVALLRGRIQTVGVVIQIGPGEERSESMHLYAKDVLAAISWAAADAGLRLTVLLARDNPGLTAAELVDGRVDGLVLASIRDEALARAVFASEFPAVTLGSGYSERRVTVDNVGGARIATEHLLGLGHRRIAYVGLSGGPTFSAPVGTSQERQFGYEDAMRAADGAPLVCTAAGVNQLLSLPPDRRPTAFFCFSDSLAVDLRRRIARHGLSVPEDVSLVGFDDNILASHLDPPLTTVHNPLDALAKAAIDALQDQWRGEEPVIPAPLPARLIVRGSTAAPPQYRH